MKATRKAEQPEPPRLKGSRENQFLVASWSLDIGSVKAQSTAVDTRAELEAADWLA